MLKTFLIAAFIFKLTSSTSFNWYSFDIKSIPDYVDSLPSAKKIDIRENFVRKKIQKSKAKDLGRLVSKSSGAVYADGIAHFDQSLNTLKEATEIENDFKSLLAMKNMKYNYKRGSHWRTWREVEDKSGKKKVVCYKCQNEVPANCTTCNGGGFWVIEETPPCPYEIFSITKEQELCAVNYTQLNKKFGKCPSVIKYIDITKTCDNPIVTTWKFLRNYSVPERKSVICGGRDFCEISTLYQIQNNQVIFRIINSSEIIYSRIMREKGKNYVCDHDCGIIDLSTFKIRPSDKSVSLNLLPNKEKREDKETIEKNKNKGVAKKQNDKNKRKDEIRKRILHLIREKTANGNKQVKNVIDDIEKALNDDEDDYSANDDGGNRQEKGNILDNLIEEFKANYYNNKENNELKLSTKKPKTKTAAKAKKSKPKEVMKQKDEKLKRKINFLIDEVLPETTTKSHCLSKKIIDANSDYEEDRSNDSDEDYFDEYQ